MGTKEYDFTLILSGISELTDDVLDRLYESGCDDALIGIRDGVVFADFSRVGGSLTEAVLSAANDVEKANVGARVVHVEPDEFVTMAEIARRLDVTREGIRKWVTGARGPGRFPPPIGSVQQKSPLWRWSDVAIWYQTSQQELRSGKTISVESASDVAALNAAFDLLRYAGSEEAMRLLQAVAGQRVP